MIKSFKKIRQNSTKESKTINYFKYAIGEILLIMFGILLALQVNNWNKKRSDLAKEQKLLFQLKNEYSKNLSQLEEKINMRNKIIYSSIQILKYIDYPENVNKDSLFYQLGYIGQDPTFDPIKNDIISSGSLRLIRNDRLKHLLSNWTSDVYQLQENEINWQKITIDDVVPFYLKMGLARDVINDIGKNSKTLVFALDKSKKNTTYTLNTSKKTLSTTKILDNTELEGVVSYAILYSQIGNMQAKALKRRILEILKIIDKEIK